MLDILRLALTAFGGPQIHFTLFHKLLVQKRKYLTEDDLKELNSFCSMLPGPTSTQTITAIGFKIGGPNLAYLTLFIWALPACTIMLLFAILLNRLALDNPKLDFLKFLQPMASGFIIYAAYRFTSLFVTKRYHWPLMLVCALGGAIITTPIIIPVVLACGGLLSSYINTREQISKPQPIKNISYSNLFLFIAVLALAAILGATTHLKIFLLFENTYRYGSIVFGGGHVLIPMMFNQFVEYKHYLTAPEFLAGVGLVQAVPGPVFSFAAFTGAMAMTQDGLFLQIIAGMFSSIAIFLPGIFLIFFTYPIWTQIKNYPPVKNAIEGINVAATGLVISSAYLLFLPVQINEVNMLVLLGTLFLLLTTKVPSPIIVLACLIAGSLF